VPGIETNQSNISQMMGLFADKELIPTTFREISTFSPDSQLRFSLQSPNNNEWNIHFGTDRIDITKNTTDTKGNNLGELEQFSADVSDFFIKIMSKRPQQANRIALSNVVILKEMSEESLNILYLKLFNPIKIYSDNKPFEWVLRTSSRIRKQINSLDEIFNFNSEINRSNGQMNINQEIIPVVDRIVINRDINSIPDNPTPRFGEKEMTDFFKNAAIWHDNLLNDIFEKIK
jgi:hypothetical protein